MMGRPGYYVEGRYYRDNFHQARARAKFLAKEYGRAISVMYLAPEDMGSQNTAVPYEVVRADRDEELT
jgi:hypothetical protein